MDGTLWVATGDGAPHPPNTLPLRTFTESSFAGKLLHVDRNGNGLPGHPFCPTTTDLTRVCTKLHAKGFRNAYRFTLRPDRNPLNGDVGWNSREEWNSVRPGGNYGWPCYEGNIKVSVLSDEAPCVELYGKVGTLEGPIMPIQDCAHPTCTTAVAGPVYAGTSFPQEYRGDFFTADYEQGFIRHLDLDVNDNVLATGTFATNAYGVVDLQQTSDGGLVYVNYGIGEPGTGSVHDIRWVAGNRAPIARASATPSHGAAPLTVTLDGSTSSDPDAEPLQHHWDFGDGSTGSGEVVTHTYTDGTQDATATLTVTDPGGLTGTTTVRISPGNTPPVLTLSAPATFRAGENVPMSVTVTDAEDGARSTARRPGRSS